MKTKTLIVISIFTFQFSFAQTAVDYYLPLCVGNYLKFYTSGNGITTNGGWEGRATYNSIIREDIINGETYYLQKGYEVMDFNSSINVFHYFWLRKDTNGDILIGAYDLTQKGTLDSATIVPAGSVFFSSQNLTLGYARTMVTGVGSSIVDSVISISETLGTHTNCIRIRTTRKNNNVVVLVEDTYYAFQLGKIKIERTAPSWQVHENKMVDSVVVNCYLTGLSDGFENKNELRIFPNPTNGIIQIQTSGFNVRSLEIYNLLGETIYTTSILKQQTFNEIDLSSFQKGIYFVKIYSGEKIYSEKIIIE